ncbi:MAG: hypothetical protein RDA78_23885 [Roseibium sp.]|uniref:SH3 domain-containing protein n=1 Tax=Roseibium sp. TaxID=1936156 RepID=UPI003D9C25D3
MYPVTAPAKSCAIQPDPGKKTGKDLSARRDFKVISGAHSSGEFRKSLRKIDPGELASKILRLHAAADREDDIDLRKPTMNAEPQDVPFEIPGVLRKSDDAEKLADVVKRSAEKNPQAPRGTGKQPSRPRVRHLVAAALLVGVAGGTALALGLPDMMAADEPETRPVATQLIVTDPPQASTVQGAVTDNVETVGAPTRAAQTEPFNAATPAQIADAKNRLRVAFASGNTGASPAPAVADEGAAAPVYPQASPDQVTTANDRPSDPDPVSAPTADLTTPAYALLASQADQSQATAVPDEGAVAANNSPEVAAGQATADVTPVESGPVQGIGAYANSGKTTASVNMRLSEQKNSEIIAVIPGNTTISFNECGKWWCGVEYDGKTGFVGQRFVKRTAQ